MVPLLLVSAFACADAQSRALPLAPSPLGPDDLPSLKAAFDEAAAEPRVVVLLSAG